MPVVPDAEGFAAQVDAEVSKTGAAAVVPVVPDATGFAAAVASEVDATKAAVEVPVVPDAAGFAEAVAAEVDSTKAAVEVPVVPDAAGFPAAVESEVAATKAVAEVPLIPNPAGFPEAVAAEAEASKATATVPLIPGNIGAFAEKTAAEADMAGTAAGSDFGAKFSNVIGNMPLFGTYGTTLEKDAEAAGAGSGTAFGTRFAGQIEGTIPSLVGSVAGQIEGTLPAVGEEAGAGFLSRFKGMLGSGAGMLSGLVPGMTAEGAVAGEGAGTAAGEGFASRFKAILGGADLMEMAVGAAAIALPAMLADKFQAAMTRIVTQAGVAASALGPLEQGVLQLAGQVGESPDSLAAALYHVESSFASVGISGKQALDILKVGAEGARVGGSDLVDTQNALDATIVSGIGGVKNYSQAMGALNAIVGSGDMTMQDLANAMGTGIMAVAKSFGQNIYQVGAALAVFGDNNIRGAKAATYLRMAMQAILDPVKTGDAALAHIGLTSTQLGQTMEHQGLSAAVAEFVQHLEASKVPVADWGQYMTDIFGKKAGVGIGVLVDQLGRLQGKFPDIEHAAGDFANAWATTKATVSQRLKELEDGFVSLGTKIGLVLLPAISQVAQDFVNALPGIEHFAGEIGKIAAPAVTDFFAGLKTILGLLFGPLKDITLALGGLAIAWGLVTLAMDMNPMVRFAAIAIIVVGAIDKLHGWMKTAAIAAAGLAAAWLALNVAMDLNPFVLIAAAIAALVVLIVKYHKQIWDAITGTWDKIAHFFEGLYDDIATPIEKAFDAVSKAVTHAAGDVEHAFDDVKTAIAHAFDDIAKPVAAAFSAVTKAAVTAGHDVEHAFDSVKHAIVSAFDDIANPVTGAFDAVKHAVTSGFDSWWKSHGMELKEVWNALWGAVTGTVTAAWQGIVNITRTAWTAVVDVFHAGVAKLAAAWQGAWNIVTTVARVGWAVITDVFNTGKTMLVNAWEGAWNIITTVIKVAWGVIEAFLKPAVAGLTSLFTTAWALVTGVFTTAWDLITTVVKAAWAVITGILNVGLDALTATWKIEWAAISAVVTVVWAAIEAMFKIAWDLIVGIFTVALDLITGNTSKAWTDIQNTVTQVWNAIKAFFATTWQAISTVFTQALNAIKAFLDTTWNAIKSGAVTVWNAITSALSSAWGTIKADAISVFDTILGVFKTFWSGLQTGFDNAVAGIKKVWDTLQAIAEAPVKFIIDTIYDQGIVKVVNAVGSLIGLSLKPISFAAGGKVTQGTGPTADDVLVRVSKGETIVSADHSQKLAPAMAAVGVPGYGAGGVPVPAGLAGVPGFASGGGPGIIGAITGAASSAAGAVGHAATDIGSAVVSVASGVASTLANLTGDALAAAASAILNPLLNAMPGGGTTLGTDLKKIPVKMVDALVAALKGTGNATGSGADIAKYAASFAGKIPYVWGGTTLGPAGADCCIIGSMHVQTTEGPKEIRDIQPGDAVITWNDGKPSVNEVTWRSEPRVQQTYRLRTGHREITASGNHPFLALRKTGRCAPPEPRFPEREKLERPYNRRARQPVTANEVRDLYLAGASLSETAGMLGISVGTALNRLKETGTPRRPVGSGPGTSGRPPHSARNDWALSWVNLEDLQRGDLIVTLKSLPDDAEPSNDPLLADPRFLWLLGLAFGDGSLGSDSHRNTVRLCVFGDLQEETQDRLEDLCGKRGYPNGRSGLCISHKTLVDGLRRYGMEAGSTSRVLPRELWTLPHADIQAFLDGYTAADGHRVKRASDPALSYKAANRGLIKDVRNLHMILGHNVTRVREMKRTRPIIIGGKQVKNALSLWTFEAYETGVKVNRLASDLLTNQGIGELFPEDSHFTPQRVLAIEPMEVEDTYDITVDDTHNFVAEGLVVHNSGFTGAVLKHYGIDAPRTSEAQGGWVKKGPPVSGGLAFYHSPAGGADPGHVAIVQDASTVISQGGGMGPQIIGLKSLPLLFTGTPPGGFGSSGGGSSRVGNLIANASTIGSYLQSHGLNKIATAGIMGNMLQESGGNWNVGGGGLIQIAGANPGSLTESLAETISYINANGGIGLLNQAGDVTTATELFMNQYERPAPATENLANRLAGANAAYAAGYSLGGVIPGGGLAAGSMSYALGGVIPEPVAGYGLHSGRAYSFAENGPETVVPGVAGTSSGNGGTVINFQYFGPQAPSTEQQQALFLKASAMIGVS